MSFSSDVKHEITTIEYKACCERAFLSAFLHINSNMIINNKKFQIQIETENAAIAKRLYSLLKERYDVDLDLLVSKKQNLRKNNIYIIRIMDQGIPILEDLGIYSTKGVRETPSSVINLKECCARAYLAGAFLASGSMNAPSTPNYHLEISTEREGLANYIKKLLMRFDIMAKVTQRRGRYIVYVKAADQIADFLKITGAHVNTLEFEDVRIQRDFKNSLTRLDNCEVANEVKSIKAGSKQLDALYLLIEYDRYNKLDDKLIQVGDLRMNYPEASLNELIYYYEEETGETISKSGLQHRFKKIMDAAKEIEKDLT